MKFKKILGVIVGATFLLFALPANPPAPAVAAKPKSQPKSLGPLLFIPGTNPTYSVTTISWPELVSGQTVHCAGDPGGPWWYLGTATGTSCTVVLCNTAYSYFRVANSTAPVRIQVEWFYGAESEELVYSRDRQGLVF